MRTLHFRGLSRSATDIDYSSVSASIHSRNEGFTHQKRTMQVDVNDLSPRRVVRFIKGLPRVDAGIID